MYGITPKAKIEKFLIAPPPIVFNNSRKPKLFSKSSVPGTLIEIPNIKIVTRNLFKYPLDTEELKDIDVVVFDPPRAGAAAQAKVMSLMPIDSRPQKIIAISCNPATFVNDANTLIQGGYKLQEVTMVDQFTYSNHSELVALFTN